MENSVTTTTTTPVADSSTETEYMQMQFEWMRTLYVNSRMTSFPKCVQNLIDNNYTYLVQQTPLLSTARSENLSQQTATQPYGTLVMNPNGKTGCDSVTRPQSLTLPVPVQCELNNENSRKSTTNSLNLRKRQPKPTEQTMPHTPTSVSGASEEARINPYRSSSLPTTPGHLEPVEEEDTVSGPHYPELIVGKNEK